MLDFLKSQRTELVRDILFGSLAVALLVGLAPQLALTIFVIVAACSGVFITAIFALIVGHVIRENLPK